MTYPNDPVNNVNAPVSGYERPVVVESSPLVPIRRAVWLIFGIIVALIAIRFFFLALGANAGNVIVDFVYGVTEPLVAPFRGIFSLEQFSPTGASVIDVGALVAIAGWALIALLVTAILRIPDRSTV
jgi:uncharacterized protein YggT (Ycf19 family)